MYRAGRDVLSTARRRVSGGPREREWAGHRLLDRAAGLLLPDYRITDYGKSWFRDEAYFRDYERFEPSSDASADRKFFLRELLKLVDGIEGDTAEAGVYLGASSWFICEARKGHDSVHWAFDSFEGLSTPTEQDGAYWHASDLTAAEDQARRVLEPYGAKVLKGWIPEVFERADIDALAFAHLDVDLYEPTLASMEFFYPLLVPGGVIVCDDYGFDTCPGATEAVDGYMSGRPEPVLHCPTGQGVIIKR